MKGLKKAVKIVLVLVLISTSFIAGYCVGVGEILKSDDGTYNVDLYDNGKIIVTTEMKYVEFDDGDLVINGRGGRY